MSIKLPVLGNWKQALLTPTEQVFEKRKKEQQMRMYEKEREDLLVQRREFEERFTLIQEAWGEEWIFVVQGNEYWDSEQIRCLRREKYLRDAEEADKRFIQRAEEKEAYLSSLTPEERKMEEYWNDDEDGYDGMEMACSLVRYEEDRQRRPQHIYVCIKCGDETDLHNSNNWCGSCLLKPDIRYFNNYLHCLINAEW